MSTPPQTLGDLLPADLKPDYSPAVLDLTLEQAYDINQEGMPWPDGFTQEDADELDAIYEEYLDADRSSDPNAPYWNKSPDENQATWSKNK